MASMSHQRNRIFQILIKINTNLSQNTYPQFSSKRQGPAHSFDFVSHFIIVVVMLGTEIRAWCTLGQCFTTNNVEKEFGSFFQAELDCALDARLSFELEIFQPLLQSSWKYRLAPPTTSFIHFVFETGSHYTLLAAWECAMQRRLDLNSQSSTCPCFKGWH